MFDKDACKNGMRHYGIDAGNQDRDPIQVVRDDQ